MVLYTVQILLLNEYTQFMRQVGLPLMKFYYLFPNTFSHNIIKLNLLLLLEKGETHYCLASVKELSMTQSDV